MQETLVKLSDQFMVHAPKLAAAFLILLVGYILAIIIRKAVHAVLERTSIDQTIAQRLGIQKTALVEEHVATLAYYVVLLFVLVAFLNSLGLTDATEPIQALLNKVFAFLPQLVAAGVLAFVAWVLASIMKAVLTAVLQNFDFEKAVTGEDAKASPGAKLSHSLADVGYWLVFLLFLPAILDALQLKGLLEPVNAMMNKALAFLPNLLTAAVVIIVGYFVARVVQRIVTNLLGAAGADGFAARMGYNTGGTAMLPSTLVGYIVFIAILLPISITALEALQIEGLSEPLSDMLRKLLEAVPAIIAAAIILVIAYTVGHMISGVVSNLLRGLGFDNILAKLGFTTSAGSSKTSPSAIVGYVVLFSIMLFATTNACETLGFASFATLFARLTEFLASALLGTFVLGLGLYFANLVYATIKSSSVASAPTLARFAQVGIIVFTGAVALRQMGIGEEIITIAFGSLVGAVAIAAALAFGLGGREIAGRELAKWVEKSRGESGN